MLHLLLLAQPDAHAGPGADRLALGRPAGAEHLESGRSGAGRLVLADTARVRCDRGPGTRRRAEQRDRLELSDREGRACLRDRHPQRALRASLYRPPRVRGQLAELSRGQHKPRRRSPARKERRVARNLVGGRVSVRPPFVPAGGASSLERPEETPQWCAWASVSQRPREIRHLSSGKAKAEAMTKPTPQ